jgi:hypothetical protein
MKNQRIISIIFICILYHSCTSTRRGTGGLSLIETIEQSAKNVAEELVPNSRVAIVAFESANDKLSEYIMEELSAELLKHKVQLVDRQNLQHVQKELNFQMSGYVSDESAMSIGKFLGATAVITGELINVGASYRYRISVIYIEEARRGALIRYDVRNDRAMQRLVETLGNQR